MRRRDALLGPSALDFHAKIQRFETGPSVGCMARAVGNQQGKNIRTIGMGCGLSTWKRFGGWFRFWAKKRKGLGRFGVIWHACNPIAIGASLDCDAAP